MPKNLVNKLYFYFIKIVIVNLILDLVINNAILIKKNYYLLFEIIFVINNNEFLKVFNS